MEIQHMVQIATTAKKTLFSGCSITFFRDSFEILSRFFRDSFEILSRFFADCLQSSDVRSKSTLWYLEIAFYFEGFFGSWIHLLNYFSISMFLLKRIFVRCLFCHHQMLLLLRKTVKLLNYIARTMKRHRTVRRTNFSTVCLFYFSGFEWSPMENAGKNMSNVIELCCQLNWRNVAAFVWWYVALAMVTWPMTSCLRWMKLEMRWKRPPMAPLLLERGRPRTEITTYQVTWRFDTGLK